ncbi:MAG: ATP-dependent DNA helicase [Sphaerochaetaceae bacterium]
MTINDIYSIFDEGGVLSKGFSGYEYREGQLKMAELVREAYERHAVLAVEAGTGIGKSFAYLVPALYNAMENPDERTVIATSTINLQRQLYEKDIPMLFRLLGRSCKVALAVGRSNYLCIRRFLQKKNESALLATDPTNDLYRIDQWARETDTGLKSDYPYAMPGDLWQDINSDGDLCPGHTCPYFTECFHTKAKLRCKEARIVVSNHHLLFSDAANRLENQTDFSSDGVLPGFDHLVIDEAHNIEGNATEYFTRTYDPKEMHRQMGIIERKSGSSPSLLESMSPYAEDVKLVDAIHDDIALLSGQVDTLDQLLLALFAKTDYQPLLVKREYEQKLSGFTEASSAVAATSGRMASKINTLIEHNDAPDELSTKITELRVRATRIQAMGEVLSSFCNFAGWNDDIHWFNTETGRNRARRVQVLITPLDISSLLVEAIFKKLSTVVCTSATLCIGNDFSFWGGRVGLPYDNERPFLSGVFPSPFDFKRRLLLLTPIDAVFPAPKQDQEPYVAYVAETVYQCIRSSEGGALVLFTSYAMMKQVKGRIEDRMAANHMTMYCQGEADRYTLLSRFISENDSSLLATSSFWEGVDAPGQTLRMVVIVKLPFQVPSDPVFKARCDALDAQGGSGFAQLGIPSATMRLKQGFGRLLRNKDDRGIVLILDGRLMSKGYGVTMLRALPQCYHPDSMTSGLCGKIEDFLFGG